MIYDYKSDELTQEIYVTCICPIVDDIIDEYSTLRRYNELSIYSPSYIAKEILGRLLENTDDLWIDVDTKSELLYNNDQEVLVTIGYDGMIFIEEAKIDGVIKSNGDCSLTYFYDGLGKKDLDALEENAESILVFGFEDDDCEGCKSEDIELAVTSNKEQYYINGKEVSKQIWEKEQKLINEEIETFRRNFWSYFGF